MTDKQLIENLFKLPWKKNNNPNGWIEVTTHCQLTCTGCYRGLDKPDAVRKHQPLPLLKKEVDDMVKQRNVECISIAGGEPLLYPHLEEFIAYIQSKGCYSVLFTNGVALNDKKCEQLNRLGPGAIVFVVHVGNYQGRGSELEVKNEIINRIQKYENLRISFTRIIDSKNIDKIHESLIFDIHHNKNLAFQLFTLRKNLADDLESDISLTCSDVVNQIRHEMPFEPCAYLPTIQDPNQIGWLLTFPVFYRGKIIGFFDAGMVEFFVHTYYSVSGKYAYIQKNNILDISLMKGLLKYKRMQEIYNNYNIELGKCPEGPIHPTFHFVLFVKPAERLHGDSWNLCDGCPDAMFYNHELVPSCLLERIKNGENIKIQ